MSWEPNENIATHGGTAIEPERVFFREPPEAIGEVLTAWTTLLQGKEPRSLGFRLLLTFGLLIGGWVLTGILARMLRQQNDLQGIIIVLGIILSPILAIVSWMMTRFKHSCSYVGTLGMARYTLKRSLQAEPAEELFLFDDATDLRTSQTRHYTNGVYTHTQYSYEWKDHNGVRKFRLNGTYRSKEGNPKFSDPWHFARVGELAWSDYLLEILQEELEEHGSVEFAVNKKDCVRIGPGFLEFHFKGNTERVESDQIKKLQVAGGSFQIDTHDARWFGSRGKFRFDYGAMANARVFIMALESLAGYQFGDE